MTPAQFGKLDKAVYGGQIVRRAQTSDIEEIMRLVASAPTAARWPREAYSRYCIAAGQPADAQMKVLFVACVPTEHNPIPAHESQNSQPAWGKIIGFAALSAVTKTGDCELENMAVAEDWRRRGVGHRLLEAGLLWCSTWCSAAMPNDSFNSGLWLEVRGSNRSAIEFYEHAGFKAAGCRPEYYAQPTDDAILMRKVFDTAPAGC